MILSLFTWKNRSISSSCLSRFDQSIGHTHLLADHRAIFMNCFSLWAIFSIILMMGVGGGRVMVCNATFNNISYIVAVSFIGRANRSTRKKLPTFRKSDKLYHILMDWVNLAWAGFELTTVVVLCTDCTGRCKSNYHTITTAPPDGGIVNTNVDVWYIEIIDSR